jgi:hypothetical protein
MNKIIIPFNLVIPAVISFGFLLIILLKRRWFLSNEKKKLFGISLAVFFAFYLYTVGSAAFYEIYYQWDLNKYDLDKNGIFNGGEITREQDAAIKRLTNDAGRNASFITGLISSAIISIVVFVVGKIYQRTKQ